MRFAPLQYLVDAVMAVFDKFAVFEVHQIRESKYLLMIGWFYAHQILLIWLEKLIEYNKCSLIIKVDLIYDFHW